MNGPGGGKEEATANAPSDNAEALFLVFAVSVLSLVAIIWTITRIFFSGEKEQMSATRVKVNKSLGQRIGGLFKSLRKNIGLVALWLVIVLLTVYLQDKIEANTDLFDPYETLQIPKTADMKQIKSAYRKMSLMYHPDKNPDPEAAAYFSEYVAKAYKTLTDDTARENWLKHGHPDGPQSASFNVALPTFLFHNEYKIILLGGIVLVGIMLPICFSIGYLKKSNKYTKNNIIVETISIWGHPQSPVSIKSAQSVHRILETFVCAMEFIEMKVSGRDKAPMEQMIRELRMRSALPGDVEKFIKRKPSVVKAHLMLLSHLERSPIPPELRRDADYIFSNSFRLLEELVKVAAYPRMPPFGYGWSLPTEAVVEFMQCMSQAIRTEDRKPKVGGKGPGPGACELLQLPGVEQAHVRKLQKGRLGSKVRNLEEMLALGRYEQMDMLASVAGMFDFEAEQACKALDAMPRVEFRAKFFVQDEDQICLADPCTCQINLVLRRANHLDLTHALSIQDKAVEACTPRYPFPRSERWYVFVGDVKANVIFAWKRIELGAAEEHGMASAVAAGLDGKVGEWKDCDSQQVDLKFAAPMPGTHEVTVTVMSDSLVGCDVSQVFKLKVEKKPTVSMPNAVPPKPVKGTKSSSPKKAIKEGSESNGSDASSATRQDSMNKVEVTEVDSDLSSDDEIEQPGTGDAKQKGGEDSDSYSDSEESVLSDFSYDSEETGTDIDEQDEISESKVWTVPSKRDTTVTSEKKKEQ